ncbi:MAG TPA: hypothetical protein VGM37_01395 [Armatimonadota bacterium]|jgi:hypothetical protein
MARNVANTRFGVDVAIATIVDSASVSVPLVAYLQDAGLKISTPTESAGSIADLDQWLAAGPNSATLDMTKVAVTTGAPLIALALSENPWFTASLQHAAKGSIYTNTSPGKWLVTSAKLSASGGGVATESMSALLRGQLTEAHTTSTSAPAIRTDGADTAYGKSVAALTIGAFDAVTLFDSLDIDVSIGTEEGHAVLDGWQWPVQGKRSVKISASRLVEASSLAPAAALGWLELARARAYVSVSIEIGNLTFEGTGMIEEAGWTHGGGGAQKETVSLSIQGQLSMQGGS